jgi:hypothetical protein
MKRNRGDKGGCAAGTCILTPCMLMPMWLVYSSTDYPPESSAEPTSIPGNSGPENEKGPTALKSRGHRRRSWAHAPWLVQVMPVANATATSTRHG